MDPTFGGDLENVAREVQENMQEHPMHSHADEEPERTEISVEEKTQEKESEAHSSDSSSQDAIAMEKIDSRIVKVEDVKEGDEAYAHLPEHEREIVKRQLDIPVVKVNYRTLYRYATPTDFAIVAISSFCAIAGGAVLPLMTVRFKAYHGSPIANITFR